MTSDKETQEKLSRDKLRFCKNKQKKKTKTFNLHEKVYAHVLNSTLGGWEELSLELQLHLSGRQFYLIK